MKKDFKTWHLKKEKIQLSKEIQIFFKEREVWICTLGLNIGKEQDGKGENFERPVLIFKTINKHTFFGIPLTTEIKNGNFCFNGKFLNGVESSAIFSQLKTFSSKRLFKKAGKIDTKTFEKLKEKLKIYLSL